MIAALLLQAADPAAVLAIERQRTAAATYCVFDGDSTDITVCGRRHADRFRVPFVSTTIARHDDVPKARAELLHRNAPIDDLSLFRVGGGEMGLPTGVGIGIGVGADGTKVAGLREIAP